MYSHSRIFDSYSGRSNLFRRKILLRGIFLVLIQASLLVAGDRPVAFVRHGDQIDVSIGGKPFTTYYFGAEAPK